LKFTTLTIPLLAITLTTYAKEPTTSITSSSSPTGKRSWTRLNIPRPLDWWPNANRELRKSEIEHFRAEHKNYEDYEEWAFFILGKCRADARCLSCVSFECESCLFNF